MTDKKLLILLDELSKSIVSFDRNKDEDYKMYFNNHSGYHEFKDNLNHLYYEFIKEVQENLLELHSEKESQIYLEMLLHLFDLLDEQVGTYPDFETPHRNTKMISRINTKVTCIHTNPDDLNQLLIYFQHQKKIIRKSIKFIEVFRSQCEKSFENTTNIHSCSEELKKIYPLIFDLKSELGTISSIGGKMEFLQLQKIALFEKIGEEEKESSLVALKFFFEIVLDCMKDLLVIEQDLIHASNNLSSKPGFKYDASESSEKRDNILWLESKAALVELIYALHGSNAIEPDCGIKDLAIAFEDIFKIDLGDVYHTYHELKNRKLEPAKFIDSLKTAFLRKIEEENEY